MAKFRVIERKRKGLYGAAALQKNFFQKNKEWETHKEKVAAEKEKAEKEKAEKEKKDVKEQTLAGAGFPTATGGGKQAIDKMPLGTKKKKKRKIIKRVLPTV